jgi:TetR/AcrR family transcriptional regulator
MRQNRAPGARRDPEATRQSLLDAACQEFAAKGLSGARVNEIAQRAGVNKQLVYYYFGNKEDLYLAVLEQVYADIRMQEQTLDLDALDPADAMDRLVGFTFDYLTRNPQFVSLLTDENLHKASHIRRSQRLRGLHAPFVTLIADTLARGARDGVFRTGVDPVQFYISMAGLCFFYYSNNETLSFIFGRSLSTREATRARRDHVIDFVTGYLRPDGATGVGAKSVD